MSDHLPLEIHTEGVGARLYSAGKRRRGKCTSWRLSERWHGMPIYRPNRMVGYFTPIVCDLPVGHEGDHQARADGYGSHWKAEPLSEIQ